MQLGNQSPHDFRTSLSPSYSFFFLIITALYFSLWITLLTNILKTENLSTVIYLFLHNICFQDHVHVFSRKVRVPVM